MSYDVSMVKEGRGGWVYYREDDQTLPFDWDITGVGFEIYTPRPVEWEAFCKQNNAMNCVDRRQEIVERIVEKISKTRGKKAEVVVDEMGISFSFEDDWLHSVLSRILGV